MGRYVRWVGRSGVYVVQLGQKGRSGMFGLEGSKYTTMSQSVCQSVSTNVGIELLGQLKIDILQIEGI